MATPRSSESIAFANQYRRELKRLERLHANNIAPGTTDWMDAIRGVFDNMDRVGSSIRQSLVMKDLFKYIEAMKPEEKTAYTLAHFHSRRTAGLSIATIGFDRHPLTGPEEEGVRVTKTVLTVKRDGRSSVNSLPLVYISQHAIERMHQRRARPLSIARATHLIEGLTMLGAMICLDAYGHDAMCLNLGDEVLAVGDIRHAVGPADEDGVRAYTAMYDVRSFLHIGELERRDKRLEQGTAAVAAIQEWAEDPYGDGEAFVRKIPLLTQERETYTAQTAKKVTEDCE